MAGYSGTPLHQKLGIKDGFQVLFIDLPADVKSELNTALGACKVVKGRHTPIDFAMIFAKSGVALKKKFPQIARRVAPAGMLWVSWPKKSSGMATSLTENEVRRIGLETGLVDVKVCAVNEVWSGLKFVMRIKDRPSK